MQFASCLKHALSLSPISMSRLRLRGFSFIHGLNQFKHVAERLEKKDVVNLMLWLQLLMLSTARRVKNE